MNTDPIADMLTRIRNALAARQRQVKVPHSKLKEAIAKILVKQHFIAGQSISGEGTQKLLTLELTTEGETPAISSLVRISKPGRRQYAASRDIPTVLSGRGIVIVSTSGGLMTGTEAKKSGLGGELICKVW
jgi:small subunit ribosomal protein S8